jgi:arginine exporter protein ArgO
MPRPKVNKNDDEEKFIDKCMSDKEKQRSGVCFSKWNKAKGTIEVTMVDPEAILELKGILGRYGLQNKKPYNGWKI